MSARPIALLDASVLVPHWSRKLLQVLASRQPPAFAAYWSTAIIAETWRVLTVSRAEMGSTPEEIGRDAYAMWEFLDPVLGLAGASRRPPDSPPSPLRDPRDEHLWNAALNANARYVLSHNTRHFPPLVRVGAEATPTIEHHVAHGIEFLTAIEFIEDVLGGAAAELYGQPLPAGVVRSRRTG